MTGSWNESLKRLMDWRKQMESGKAVRDWGGCEA